MKKHKNLKEEVASLEKKLKDAEWASEKTKESLKILYRELEEKNNKLKELDQLKSQFVANVAHEFKTPLIIVKEGINLAIDGTLGRVNPQQEDVLLRGKRAAERLLRLVTDLLDLAKIEAGKMFMKREKVNMAFLAEELLAAYEREFSKKQITLEKHIARDAGFAWCDKDKISEVITNLIYNAVKYTPEKGAVGVSLTGDEKEIRFEIRDSGCGIAKENLEKVFDKFERLGVEKKEGTGLGLAISKDIIELHKGRLWVESEVAKGSVFIFVLPRDLRELSRE